MSQTTQIDFGTLTLVQALDLAVLIEEEARDRYAELAQQLELHHTPEAAAFFSKMARIEELHRESLVAKRSSSFGSQPTTVSRKLIFDVEAPEYDEARAYMTVREALETALRSEIKAHDFFDSALKQLTDPAVTALFQALREEEVEHQELVKGQLSRLPVEPKVNPKDYEDEPVSED